MTPHAGALSASWCLMSTHEVIGYAKDGTLLFRDPDTGEVYHPGEMLRILGRDYCEEYDGAVRISRIG